MKEWTVRVPDDIASDIANEAHKRGVSQAKVVRERLEQPRSKVKSTQGLLEISDVIGSIDDALPADLSARKKHYLRTLGYGRNRAESKS